MPILKGADVDIPYRIDDFTDPWTEPETIVLLHGLSESNVVWYAWVPILARRYRVVRADLRGFGASTPMPRDFPWSLDILAHDVIRLMDSLGTQRFHVVGAKVGSNIGRALAARYPARVKTLSLVGTPPPYGDADAERIRTWTPEYEKDGVEPWARRSMANRLGEKFPAEGAEWWIKLMGRTAASTQIGFLTHVFTSAEFRKDVIAADLAKIMCPTLVMTTEGNPIMPVAETRKWQAQIKNSKLIVIPDGSYHAAASHPDFCANAVLEFISAQPKAP